MFSERKRTEDAPPGDAQLRPASPVAAPPPPPQPQGQRTNASVIGPDLTINGNLQSRGAVQVNGQINGDVECDLLAIGENGIVRGNIVAQSVRISGSVEGEVRAKDVIISRTARMIGDVLHESLTVEQGALLEGHCARIKDPAQATERPVGATELVTQARAIARPVEAKPADVRTDAATEPPARPVPVASR